MVVTLEGSKMDLGAARRGHFRGAGHSRGVVSIDGFHLVMN